MDNNVQDVKVLKQNLQVAKDQRMDLIIQLGELAHQQLRKNNNLSNDGLKSISDEVLKKDILIYQTQNSIIQLNANNAQCPNCKQNVSVNAKFCGNCGTLNPYYFNPNAQSIECNECQQLIDSQNTFCPCCGAKQGASE